MKFFFLTSHLGSGSEYLWKALDANPRIQMYDTQAVYASTEDVKKMTMFDHKLKSTGSVYGDHLLYNSNFTCSELYKCCKFIYLIRSAKETFNLMKGYSGDSMLRYYSFRLRRMAEMALKTPGAVFVTWKDLQTHKGLDVIANYLGLRDSINLQYPIEASNIVPNAIVEKGNDCYERYLYLFKQMDLKRA